MDTRNLSIKAGWLLSLRLTTYILISAIVLYWMRYPDFLSFPFFAYSLLTLMLPFLQIFKKRLTIPALQKIIPITQILFEIVIEIGIIYTTGNINSAYSGLFILTIISAALVTNLAGNLGIASVISISYAFVVWLGLSVPGDPGSSSRALETIFSSEDAAFYNIFLHILIFFLVAFISGYLVERLIRKDKELEDKSKALKQARLETDDILKHLNSGLLTVDKDCRVIFFNRGAEDILGYRESDIKGQDIRDIFSERLSELSDNLLSVLYTRKEKPRIELDILNAEGKPVPIGVSTSLLLDDDQLIRGVIAIFQDLTETKKLEDKIRMADRLAAVGELSAAIAHEIRNPLAAISGSVEVLSDNLNVDGEDRRLLELIVKESNRLNNILSDFLLYARIKRSTPVRIELYRLVSNVIEMAKHYPSYHDGMKLYLTSLESCVYVFSDEDQLKQILINLIVNACEALPAEGGEVEIKIDRNSDSDVHLSVIDNGSGMTEELLNKVYAPFYSTKGNGTGLGLAIVQRLSKSLRLQLSCQSKPGRGTKFTLVFMGLVDKQPKKSGKEALAEVR